jgi:hypothetical protein
MRKILVVLLLSVLAGVARAQAPEPMWNGTILSQCSECSGWTLDQLRCGIDDPKYANLTGSARTTTPTGKEVAGWHVEEDPSRTEYRLHAGGWMPSGIPVPICVLDKPLPGNPIPKASVDVTPDPPKPVIVNTGWTPDKPWYKDWKPLSVLGLAVGSGIANIKETDGCRARVGISPCNGGYGALTARNYLNLGASVGFAFISIWGRHMGFKEWAAPSLGFSTYQTYEAVHQATIGCPVGQHYLYGTKYTCVPNYIW